MSGRISEPDRERQEDDRHAPAAGDALPERQDVVEGIQDRLGDDCDREHGFQARGRKSRLVLDEVDAAVAPGVAAQQAPSSQDQAPQYAVLADGRPPRSWSSSGGTCSAGAVPARSRVGRAARARRPPTGGPSSGLPGGQAGARRAGRAAPRLRRPRRAPPRGGPPRVVRRARSRARPAGPRPSPRMPLAAGASRGFDRRRRRPCGPPRSPGAARLWPLRAGTNRGRGSGWRASGRLGRRGRTRRCARAGVAGGESRRVDRCRDRPRLRGQPAAALAAPALQDMTARARAHASAEPVCPGALALLGLVGALHLEGVESRGAV